MQSRNTRQRAAIRAIFEHSERPLSVDEVFTGANQRGSTIGIATVYRTLAALVDEEWLELVEIPGEPARYERTGKAHHHHFQCEKCERAFDIPGCVENIRTLVPRAFRLREHAVTLYGLCAQCAR